jgi:hypothetical protein
MPEEKRKLNYYRLKAGRLEFRLPLRSSRLKDYAPKGGGFQPHPAFGGLKRFTDNDLRLVVDSWCRSIQARTPASSLLLTSFAAVPILMAAQEPVPPLILSSIAMVFLASVSW